MSARSHPLRLLWSALQQRTPAERERLARHLEVCPDCREEAGALASMTRSLRAQGDLDHIPVEDLVRMHDGEPGLDPRRRAAMRAHLLDCLSCREDLGALAQAGPGSWPARRARLRPWVPAVAAAVLLVCLGAGIGRTLQGPGSAPPPGDIVLQAPRRGVEEVPRVRAGAPHTFRILLPLDAGPGPFRVRIGVPEQARGGGDGVIVDAGPDGRIVVSLRAPAAPGWFHLEVQPVDAAPGAQAIVYAVHAVR